MIAGALEIQLFANLARLQKDMDEAKQLVGGAMANIERYAALAKNALVGLGAVGIATALAHEVKAVIDYADQLNKLSQRAGVAAEVLSELHYAAKLADVSQDSFNTGVKKLNVSIAEGLAGDKEKVAIFKALGITTRDLGLGTEAVLLKMADAYEKGADGPGKTASAVKLLGKAGDEMIPFLNGGSKAILDLREEARRLGLTIGTDFARQAEEFNDNLTRVGTSGQRLVVTLGADLVKGLGATMKAMADAAIEGGKLQGVIAGLQTLLTGTDRYKNDKAIVEQTDNFLKAQKAYEDAVRMGDLGKNRAITFKGEMDRAKAELDLTLKYRNALDEADARAAAAAAREAGKPIKMPGAESKSEYDKIIEKINAKMAAEEAEKKVGRELTASEQFHLQVLDEVAKARAKLSAAQIAAIDRKAGETLKIIKENEDRERSTKARLAAEDEYQRTQQELTAATVADSRAREQAGATVQEYALSVEEAAAQLEVERRMLGATDQQRQTALEHYRIELDLKKQLDAVNRNLSLSEADREELRASLEASAAIAKASASARAELEEHKRILSSIDSTAHDVFVNIFEGGQDAFKKLGAVLKSTLLDVLYQLTVRPFVIQLAASFLGTTGLGGGLMSAAGSALGGSLFGGGGGLFSGVFNPIMNGAGNIGSSILGALGLGGAAASGLGLTAALGAGTTLAATGAGLGLTAGLGSGLSLASAGGGLGITASSAGAGAIGAGLGGAGAAGATGLSGALAAIPGWGWAALGIGALLGLGGGGDSRNGGGYTWTPGTGAFFHGGPGGLEKQIAGDQAVSSVNAAAEGINGMLSALGSSQQISSFYAALESSKKGRGGVMSGGTLSNGMAFGEDTLGSNYSGDYFETSSTQSPDDKTALANFVTDLKQVTIEALQAATDIPETIAAKLRGINAEALSDDAVQALLTDISSTITAVQGLREAVQKLPFDNLKGLSFDAAAGLINLAGGLDTLNSSLTSYYQDFYTQAERTDAATRQITDALAALGYQLPSTRDGFRGLVDAQNLSTESGRAAYAALLKLAPAFASITQSADDLALDAAAKAKEVADAWRSVGDKLYEEVARIRGLSDGPGGYASAQARFAVATAQARAGDMAAANELPGLSQALLQLAAENSASALDLQRVRALTANSLESTAALFGALPTVASSLPVAAPTTLPAAPYVAPAASAADLGASLGALRVEVAGLRAEVAAFRADNSAENRALVNNSSRAVRVAEDWDTNGLPAERTA